MEGFSSEHVDTGEAHVFVRSAGGGPPLLLLHGFPQTHLMWRKVAPLLAQDFTVICADLRGYGQSSCPPSDREHAAYSKRTMARDMLSVMRAKGFESFAVAGHDRGARVAYRLALDHPDRVTRIAVLDIVPTASVWACADERFAMAFWPWTLLAQESPLPEAMLTSASRAIVEHASSAWGSEETSISPHVRAVYASALADPAHAHAICEEYRAAATLDRDHDLADRAIGRKISCPLLALWSAGGPVDTWYAEQSGPLALWREYAHDVRGETIDGGHFFPEQNPERTADVLRQFFQNGG
jgi:haloacetate dehalogenase